ncbi:DsrE family protein [uncultured Desulfuromonas sp.]|uniref:DsrE family protein n=1 Tax=uncultured Desulfuromonas sp. TaxID=181013 RepID=UPI002AAC42DC|nr:DsrE family protein [uncultured Desulfuromonas sp.]
MSRIIMCLLVLVCVTISTPALATQKVPNDHRALAGMTTGKAVFDVNISSAQSMLMFFNVIEKTVVTLKDQGVKPDFIITLRGAAVSIVSKDSEFNSEEDETALIKKISDLKQQGVYFEACNVAADLFAVDTADLFPGVVLVGNTFASLIGYQNQGYALIPLY